MHLFVPNNFDEYINNLSTTLVSMAVLVGVVAAVTGFQSYLSHLTTSSAVL
jgi:hypothetical protein